MVKREPDKNEIKDRIDQIHGVNDLASKELITHTQRLRAHSKIVPGLGEEIEKKREREHDR